MLVHSFALLGLIVAVVANVAIPNHHAHLAARHDTIMRRTTSNSTVAARACAPVYTNSKTINGPGTLPRPTTFVKRSGTGLTLNGKAYKIVGPNIYWYDDLAARSLT